MASTHDTPLDRPEEDRAESILDGAFDRAVDSLQRGERPDAAALAGERRDLLEQIEALIVAAERVVAREPLGEAFQDLREVPGYRVIGMLGRGGMGVVYRAQQVSVADREVALKVLPAGALGGEGGGVARFRQESRAVARLKHPNIIAIYDVTASADGPAAIAMELVEGASLGQVIARLSAAGGEDESSSAARSASSGRRSASTPALMERVREALATPTDGSSMAPALGASYAVFICRLGAGAARALEAVHRAGLIHRDVKPGNILLRRDGTPVLTDFGLARDAAATGEATMHTQTGAFVGTAAYAAPEQVRGEHERVDARSDVYSLGATLFHALTLRPMPARSAPEALRMFERGHALPPIRRIDSRLPRDLETIIAKATEPDPSRRYASAADLADDLERVVELRPIRARAVGPVGRGWRFCRRHRGLVIGSAIAFVSIVAGVLIWAQSRTRHLAEMKSMEVQAGAARETFEFVADLLREAHGRSTAGLNVEKALHGAAKAIERAGAMLAEPGFGDDPAVQSEYHKQLGELCYYELGLLGLAEGHFRQARELMRSAGAENRFRALDMGMLLAHCLMDLTRPAEAELFYREAVEGLRGPPEDHSVAMADALQGVARAIAGQGRFEEAVGAFRKAIEFRRELGTVLGPETLEAMNKLGDNLRRAGRAEDAESVLRDAIREAEGLGPDGAGASIMSKRYLARILVDRKDLDGAEAMQREVLEASIAIWTPHHFEVSTAECELAKTKVRQGDLAAAEGLYREALVACRQTARPLPKNEVVILNLLAGLLDHMPGREADAKAARAEAAAAADRVQGKGGAP